MFFLVFLFVVSETCWHTFSFKGSDAHNWLVLPEFACITLILISLRSPNFKSGIISLKWMSSDLSMNLKLIINGAKGMRISRSLEVWKMGSVNYLEALKLQDKLVSDRKTRKISDTLLSLQHPPTYTLGKRRTDHNLLVPETDLRKIGAELHYTQRGGDITFHGPHQAILYPIISLRDIGLGARNYVEKLELTMIELASLYGVKACAGQTGETGGGW